jgi:hypothetical protein
MANRTLNQSFAIPTDTVEICGSILTNGNAAPAAASVVGKGFSTTIAYDSTNKLYTITLDDTWNECHFADCHLSLATEANNFARIKSVDLANKQVVIRFTNVTPAAANPPTSDRVYFRLVVR